MAKHIDSINLTNQFLIAMPGMDDAAFSGTVVYLCDHSERGALGLVINRPTDINLGSLFRRIDLKLEIQPLQKMPVYFGGPVQTERGFVFHVCSGRFVDDHVQRCAGSGCARQGSGEVSAYARSCRLGSGPA